jgi:hypothetical protein
MKSFKIIAVTAILTGSLFIAGSVHAVLVLSVPASAGSVTTKSPSQPAQAQPTIPTTAQPWSTSTQTTTPVADTSLNAQVATLQAQVADLQARLSALEAKQGTVANTATPAANSTCPSLADQIAKGYVYNMCTGKKL